MKGNKTKNTERGIINPNGIIIDGDIAISTGIEPGKDRLLLMRVILCILSSLFTMNILCSFIHAKSITFLPIVLVTLAFAALCTGNGMFKVFGIGYFVFQISYLIILFNDIINGCYIALDRYLKLADITVVDISEYVKQLDPKQHDYMLFHFLMFLAAIVTALIALACILRFDFPIYFIATFPFMEIGLYHGWNPPTFSAVGLVIGWIIVLSVTMINHSTNKAGINNTFAVHRRKRAYYFTSKRLKNRFFTNYISIIAVICACVFAVSILFSAVTGFVRPKSFDRLRSNITEAVDNFSIDKLSELFDKFGQGNVKEVGPTNGGRLGEKDGIEFDNSTALDVIVLYQPAYTLYLRGYVAGKYSNNTWDPIELDVTDNVYDDFKRYGDNAPIQNFNHIMYSESGLTQSTNTISVGVGEADERFAYAPYMTDYLSRDCVKDEIIELKEEGSVKLNKRKYQLDFYDMSIYGNNWNSSNGILSKISYLSNTESPLNFGYSSFVNQVYKQVYRSPGLENAFDDISEKMSSDIFNRQRDMFSCYEAIREYLDSKCKYDLNPGKTETGRDFIDYFLTEQKKGYCSYFASAGAMLMRKFGYPTRYVEGYVIAPTEFITTSDSKGNTVIKVNVTDKSAHAWCEVFVDNIGWVPLEFTPGYQNGGNPNKSESELNPNKPTTTTPATTTTQAATQISKPTTASNKSSSSTTTTKAVTGGSGNDSSNTAKENSDTPSNIWPILKTILAYVLILAVIVTAFIINRMHKLKKQRGLISQQDRSKAVIYIYIYYLKYLSLINISDDSNVSDEAQALNLISKCRQNGLESIVPDITMISGLAIEAHLRSNSSITEEEVFSATTALEHLKAGIVPDRLSFIGRFAAKWLYGLY